MTRMPKKFSSAEEVEKKKQRMADLRDYYNLVAEQDVVILGIRVLEHAMTNGSGIYTVDEWGDFYEIEIG